PCDGNNGEAWSDGPQTARNLEPVHVGQFAVQENQRRGLLGGKPQSALTILGLQDRVPLRLERQPHHLPGCAVVLDDQDERGGHGASPCERRCSAMTLGNESMSIGFAT